MSPKYDDDEYFVAYFHEVYGWDLVWQSWLWHHSGCYPGAETCGLDDVFPPDDVW